MEEVINSIRRVCELAKNLETELPNLSNQPAMLSLSIDEIVGTLSSTKERLLSLSSFSHHEMLQQLHEMQQPQMNATLLMQEWLRSSCAMTMDNQLFKTQQLQAARSTTQPYEARSKGSQGEMQAIEAPPSRSRRSNRRNIDLEIKRKTIVPAPLFGNTEMPPEDGFTWRKYGQKEILGSKYPRSYYRCTHQKLYECQARKQVQRQDQNPRMFEVTYRGNHICCHVSSTASSLVPPQQLVMDVADVLMFNSGGSSSGNSMESLFPPAEDYINGMEPKEAKRRN